MDINVEQEKELIKRYQRTKNPLVFKELQRRYDSLIRKAVLDSGLSNFIADQSTIMSQALAAFEGAITDFKDNKNAKPSTFITQRIDFALRNYKNRMVGDVSHKSDQMSRKTALYQMAINQMSTDPNFQNATDKDILKHIKNMKDSRGKPMGRDFVLSDIKKIKDLSRTELIGSKIINAGTGEDISQHELSDTSNISAYDIMRKQQEAKVISDILNTTPALSPKQKNYIRRLCGLGRMKRSPNKSRARVDSGVTLTEAYKAETIVNEQLRRRGMFDI